MLDTDTSAADAAQADSNPFLDYAIERGYDPRKKIKKNARHVLLGQAVVAYIRASGEALISETRNWIFRQPELWRNRAPQQDRKPSGARP
jgi:hypothetical protein